jgi:hypothetical protein
LKEAGILNRSSINGEEEWSSGGTPFFSSHHLSDTIRRVLFGKKQTRRYHHCVFLSLSVPYHHPLINLLSALTLFHFGMANTNSATSHPKAPAADRASKPSATSRTKATAPRNINLDEDEENIVPERTRTDRSRSTKQAQIGKLSHIATSDLLSLASDEEALDKEMAALSKKLNAYKKTKRQQEKSW